MEVPSGERLRGERLRGKRQAWCLLQVKLCYPCLSALEWFVYHTRCYTSARIFLFISCVSRYLADCCVAVSDIAGRQRLRSAHRRQLDVPRHQRSTLGRRAFSVAGPIVWNSLPDELRDDMEESCFRQSLKHCFSVSTSVPSALEVYLYTTMRYINRRFTYLLTC